MKLLSLLLLSTILYISIISSTSFAVKNTNFTACNQTITCGSKSNISYPFYDVTTRPDYCGYPGFKIKCIDNQLQINISDQNYHLLGIDPYSTTLTVARNDTLVNGGCPSSAMNTTIDFSKFDFTSADENITFFYGCSGLPTGLNLIYEQCEVGSYGVGRGYFLTPDMVAANGLAMWERCDGNLFLPYLKEFADEIQQWMNWTAIVSALGSGFKLSWFAENSWCAGCVGSGGLCGYGSGRTVCHCVDQDFYTKCGVDPTTGGGKNNKVVIGIGIGAGLGVALLLVGSWSLFARRRKPNKSQDVYPAPPYNSSSTRGGGLDSTSSGGGYTSTPTTYQSQQSQSMPSYSSSDIEKNTGGGGGRTTYFGVRLFTYNELEQATNNFDESKELGDGGFGTVYYGQLPDGQPIAVKRLYENSFRRVEQSFMNEIEILAKLRHDHLVTLYGCTSRHSRDLLLVYEYVSNGTVADHLHGKRASSGSFLSWPIRLAIATETAEALLYLHRSDIIHRDVKTPNILLDGNFRVKVADFGLSRLFPNDVSHVSTAPQGTPGYVDPEYFQCYRLTEKSDVYSFGVVLVELVSSKQAVDITRHRHDINLSNMAIDRIKSGALGELVDERLGFDGDQEVERGVRVVCELAFRCLQQEREMRPSMEEIVEGLRALRLREESFKKKKEGSMDLIDVSIEDDQSGQIGSFRNTN